MRRTVLAAAALLICSLPAFATQQIGDLKLATSFDTLMTQAQESHRVMVLKFYTDW